MDDVFTGWLKEVKPIRFKEPLAQTLGAFREEGALLDYGLIDVIKMAGHICPTVAGAYLACQAALEKLYPGEAPVRGEIGVTVYGEPDEGAYGVMGQVFSFLTGAAPETGFKGLGHMFKRKNLLKYSSDRTGGGAMCFKFQRLDTGRDVFVKLYNGKIPFPAEKDRIMARLLEKVLWEAEKPAERKEFRDLWMEKIKLMVLERKGMDTWLKIEGGNRDE